VKKNFGMLTTSKLSAKGKISTKNSCFHFTKQHISRDGVFGYFNSSEVEKLCTHHLEHHKAERSPSQTKPPKQRLAQEKHHIQDNLGSRYQMMKDYLVAF